VIIGAHGPYLGIWLVVVIIPTAKLIVFFEMGVAQFLWNIQRFHTLCSSSFLKFIV